MTIEGNTQQNQASAVKGNSILVTGEEALISNALKEKNLAHVNEIAAPVHPKDTIYTRYVKRILDLLIALPVFLITLPLNLVFAVLTLIDVGTPILFQQTRCGMKGKNFNLIKFRNMTNKTDADGKLLPAAQRVTKFGKIMRKLSLDELLNFWSVVKGDMSIIGPRPIPVFYEERMSERHKMRNAVRPGLECPRVFVPEIKSGDEVSAYHTKFENDIWYVENVSFLVDLKMISLLVKMTFAMGKRGNHASHASYFVGYDQNGYAISLAHFKKLYPEEAEAILSKRSA